MSKYIDLRDNCNKELLVAASNCIKEGKLVIFPTETVYGIGADGLNANAVKNIFIAKGRASDNPLILHVSSIDMINRIAYIESKLEKDLINAFFPGPLTIILKKKEIVPNIVCGNLDTVGVRMPINNIAHDLIELSNTPIAAPRLAFIVGVVNSFSATNPSEKYSFLALSCTFMFLTSSSEFRGTLNLISTFNPVVVNSASDRKSVV